MLSIKNHYIKIKNMRPITSDDIFFRGFYNTVIFPNPFKKINITLAGNKKRNSFNNKYMEVAPWTEEIRLKMKEEP